jgi:large repetitive protein
MGLFARRHARRGFSLSELTTVLVVLAIIGTVVFPAFVAVRSNSRVSVASASAEVFVENANRLARQNDVLAGNRNARIDTGEMAEAITTAATELPGKHTINIDPVTGGLFVHDNGTEVEVRVDDDGYLYVGDRPSAVITAPDAPASIAASRGDTQVSLSWTAPTRTGGQITGYVVEYSISDGPWASLGAGESTSTLVSNLTNGVSYRFRVAATNSVGTGPFRTSKPVIPGAVPSAPRDLGVVITGAQAALSWTAPETDGGLPVFDYVIEYTTTGTVWIVSRDGVSAATTATVAALSRGTEYTFRVAARTEIGTGTYAVSEPAAVTAAPGAPGNVIATPGDEMLSVTWAAPVDDGGTPVTDYVIEYSTNAVTWFVHSDGVSTDTDTTIAGLTNGTPHLVRVAARNTVGTGEYATAPSATPYGVPTAPGNLSAAAGNAQITITWTAPSNNGSAITDYVVQYSTNGSSWITVNDGVSTATNATITGLVNGTTYTTRVAAVNAAGTGAWSAPSGPTTPATTPGAPTNLAAAVGNGQVTLSWTAPVSNGGSPITDYVIEYSTNGSTWIVFADGVSTATTATITGLVNGQEYLFRSAAVNAVGIGGYATTGNAAVPATTPGTPTNLVTTAGNAQIALSWTAPADGGAAITDYVIEYSTNGSTWIVFADGTATATSTTITGLVNGTTYTVRVAAVNSVGTGAYATSSPVTPATTPGAPTNLTTTIGNTQIALSWTAPASNGGAALTDYVIQYSTNGSTWTTFNDGTSTTTSTTVTGLTNGQAYTVRVAAINAVGTGSYVTSGSVTPGTVPGTPTGLSATAGNAQIALSWTAPANTGGYPITDYAIEYSTNGSTWIVFADGVSTATTATITGVSNGTTYTVRVRAQNAIGSGSYVTSGSVTPATTPGAPTNLIASAGNAQISLTWTAPASNGGSAITDYVIQYSTNGSTWVTFADGTSTTTSTTITGVSNGTTYTTRVAAVNAAGTGNYVTSGSVTPAGVPGTPSNLVATAGNGQISLSWTAPSNNGAAITDYVVEYSTNGSTWTVVADGVSTATSATITGLTNGTTYTTRVAAVNSVGTGSYATSGSVTPATTPSAPTNLAATAGNAQIGLSWTAPASNGGSALVDYVIEYSSNGGTTWVVFADGTSTATSTTITGVSNGTAYTTRVAAVNSVGTGSYVTSGSVTPATTPGAPTNLTATAGNGQISLSWTAPASNGGAAITDYVVQYSTNGSTWTTFADGTSTTTSTTITGLTNGTAYTTRVAAVNAVGASSYTTSGSVTPATVPGAPTNLVTTAGNAQVSLSWTAPASNGGAAITDYVVQYSTNGSTWTTFNDGVSATTSATVTALANGTAYTLRVAAINAVGTGSYVTSGSVTPATTPGAPTNLVTTAGSTQIALSWTAPASNGGAAITDYVVQHSTNGSTWITFADGTSTATSATITGLVNGTTYTVRVAAINAVGTGSYVTSGSVTPAATVPGAPTGLSPTAGNAQIALSWTAPASNGGAAITDYVVQHSINGSTWTTFNDGVSTATTATITGLVNGTAYTVRVAAVNSAGTGSYGTAGPVTPVTTPDAPTNLVTTAGNAQIALSWTAPASNGGAAITDYVVQYSTNGSTWTTFNDGTSTATSATIAGLTNGTAYTTRVAAVNAVGTGSYVTSGSVTPATVPGVPTGLSSTAGNAQIALSWAAPASNGGAAITDYVVEYSTNGSTWIVFADGTSTATTATITGLVNGTAYTARVAAVNAAGTGSYVTSGSVTPATTPGAPTGLNPTAGNAQIALSWTAPASNGGSAITDYIIQHSTNGSTWVTFSDGTSTATSTTITGLVNGTTYTVRVAAVNAVGTGSYVTSGSVTPATTPGTPTNLVATAGNAQASLTWTAPTSNGGAAITDYVVQYSTNGSTWTTFNDGVSTTTSATVTALVNGTAYTLRVAAVNAAGAGSYVTSGSVTPATVPGAPIGLTATPGNGQVTLEWAAPASNGGAAITDYAIQYRTGTRTGGVPTVRVANTNNSGNTGYVSTFVNTLPSGIQNGDVVVMSVHSDAETPNSINTPSGWTKLYEWQDGVWDATAVFLKVRQAGDPNSVTITSTTTGLGRWIVNNAAISGAAAPASWTYVLNSEACTYQNFCPAPAITAAANSLILRSLHLSQSPNSTQITSSQTIIATSEVVAPEYNSSRRGALASTTHSAASNWSWTGTGGRALTATFAAPPAAAASTTWGAWTNITDGVSSATSATLTGLSNNVIHEFRVAATNSVGTGAYSTAAEATPALSAPGAPTNLVATAGSSQVAMSWTAPSDNGGSAITDYVVEHSTNGTTWVVFADGVSTATNATITGLTNGQAYTVRVAAKNAIGTGNYVTSGPVTPVSSATVPGAPTNLAATAGNAQVSLTWTAPVSNGGSAITDYVIQYRTATTTAGAMPTVRVSSSNNSGDAGYVGSFANTLPAGIQTGDVVVMSVHSDATNPNTITTPAGWTKVYEEPQGLYNLNTMFARVRQAGDPNSVTLTTTSTGGPGRWIVNNTVLVGAADPSTWVTGTATCSSVTSCAAPAVTAPAGSLVLRTLHTSSDATVTSAQTILAQGAVVSVEYNSSRRGVLATTPGSTTSLWTWSGTRSAITATVAVPPAAAGTTTWSAWTTFNDGTSTATSATVTSLANNVTHEFRVAATNAIGTGAYSTTAEATPSAPTTTPSAPTNLTGSAGNAQVALSWTAPSSTGGFAITDYVVEYSTNGSTWVVFADGVSTSTSATVTALTNGQSYTFRVAAKNSSGTGAYASTPSLTPSTTPGTPTGLTATGSNTQVALTWAEPSDGGAPITDYTVQYRTAATGSSATTAASETWTGSDGTAWPAQWSLNSASNGSATLVANRGRLTTTQGAYAGKQAMILADVVPADFEAVVDLTPQVSGDTERWSQLMFRTDGVGYEPRNGFAVDIRSTGAVSVLRYDNYTRTSLGLSSAISGTTLRIRVRAQGSNIKVRVWSTAAAEPSTWLFDLTDANHTTRTRMMIGLFGGNTVATRVADWDNLTVSTIATSGTDAGAWTTFADGTSAATSATVTGLANSTSYDFQVAATNARGTGSYSATASATPTPSAPNAPTNLTGTAGSAQVALSWTAPANNGGSAITDYVVEYSTNGTVWVVFTDGVSTATTATVTGLTNGTAYTLRVAAVNAIGTGSYATTGPITPVGAAAPVFVASGSGTGTSVALSGAWQPGDIAIAFAYRNSNTVPSAAAGWTDIATSGGSNTNSRRTAYRVLQAGDTTVGAFANATHVQFVIVRGQRASSPIGATASAGTANSSVTLPALTLANTTGSSLVIGFAGSNASNTGVAGATVTGATNRSGGTTTNLGIWLQDDSTANLSAGTISGSHTSPNRTDRIEILAP